MHLMYRQGGNRETFPGHDGVRVHCLHCLWHRCQRHQQGSVDLRAKGFCGVHDNRISAQLGTVFPSFLNETPVELNGTY